MKKAFFFITIVVLLGTVLWAHPQYSFAADYVLLEPSLEQGELAIRANADFGTFMNSLYTGVFKFAGLLAVVMLIYGGVLYVFGGLGFQATEKGIAEAKDVFFHLGVGGAILLTSYLALYTINPKLVDMRFSGDNESFPPIWEVEGYSTSGFGGFGGGGGGTDTSTPGRGTGGDYTNSPDVVSDNSPVKFYGGNGISIEEAPISQIARQELQGLNETACEGAGNCVRIARIERNDANPDHPKIYLTNTSKLNEVVRSNRWFRFNSTAINDGDSVQLTGTPFTATYRQPTNSFELSRIY